MTRRSTHRGLLALLLLSLSGLAFGHTLGIDKAELIEHGDRRYALVVKVPAALVPSITAPRLPEHCSAQGNPRGQRGDYQLRFEFSCDQPLSAQDHLSLPWQREGVMLTVRWQGQQAITRLASRAGGAIPIELADYLATSGSVGAAAKRYTLLGIEHILEGLDHLLFVLALLLLVDGTWRLVKTVTAFTVAHSITLGLATLGYVKLPSAPVEASIALSIVFLSVEIIHVRRGRPSLTAAKPWLVAFAFGLLHGLGFAGALAEIGLPPPEIPLALLFFNIGVELGQLLFIAFVLATLAAARRLLGAHHALRFARPTETVTVYAIGTLATYWFIDRSGTIFGWS